MTHSDTTCDQLRRYRAGERDAEHDLFERHRAALVQIARRSRRAARLAPHLDPEDLVNAALMRAVDGDFLRRRFEHRGRGSLERALTRILLRTILDAARRANAAKRRGAPSDPAVLRPRAATSPSSCARTRELIDRLREHLDRRELAIYVLTEIEGRCSAEVAREVGLSEGRVRALLPVIRAKARLIATDARTDTRG